MKPTPARITREELKEILLDATSCDIQHDGWTCGTCFYGMGGNLTNKDWQAVLLTRGDTPREAFGNLPKDIQASLRKVVRIAEKYISNRREKFSS